VRLRDVCDLVGDSIDPQLTPTETFAHYSIPAYDARKAPALELGKSILSNKISFPRGAVLFSKLNPRISRVWHVDDAFPYRRICSTEFLPLVARSAHALPAYIALVLQEPEVIGRLRAKVAAATKSRERLGPALVLDAEVPLPALDQQRRLVALFMDQMAAVERARAAAGAQLEAARAFPRACLRAAFESDATREWVQVRLGDLALSIQNGIYKVAHHYGHGMPLLRMYNLQRGSWCLDLGRLALAELSGAEATTFQVMPGDLLISRVNSFELVGKCSLVDERAAGFAFENMLIRVRLGEGVEPLFIAQQLSADRIRKQIKGLAKRAIGQASINCDDIRQLELLLPPLSTQRRIATDLARRNLEAEVLKKRLETEFEVVAAFPAALLRRAFSGEL
jgi:type I restriction enzyme S subunit